MKKDKYHLSVSQSVRVSHWIMTEENFRDWYFPTETKCRRAKLHNYRLAKRLHRHSFI